MADNYIAKDANGANITFRAIDAAGILTPVHTVETLPLPSGAATSANQSTTNSTLSTISGKLPSALGQTTMAASLSVTVASNQSAIPIADGGGSITVDGTVAATQSGTWNVADGGGSLTVDGTVAATQSGTWNINAITTLPALVAGSATVGSIASVTTSITPGTAAAQLGKAEDAAHASGDVGVMALGVRQDSDGSLASADGDYTPPMFASTGRLKVDLGIGPLLPLKQEDAASAGADAGIMVLAVRNDAGTSLVGTDGDYSALSVDSSGALRVTGAGGGGGGDASAANQTTMIGHLANLVGATKLEDAAHTTADRGVYVLAVRTDTAAASAGTDGDYESLHTNATGALRTTIDSISAGANVIGKVSIDQTTPGTTNLVALAANQSVNVAQINGVTPLMGNGASGTGAMRVTLANDSTGILATVTNVATIGTSVTPGTSAAHLGKARDAVAGGTDTGVAALLVRRDSPTAVTPAAGDYETPQIDANGSQWVHPVMGATGGATPYQLISAASTNATNVKSSAGTLTSIVATNNHATSLAYLKIYNKASAPTVGTDTPVATYTLAPNGGGLALTFPTGMALGTGISFAITGLITVADTTAVAASQVAVALTYH